MDWGVIEEMHGVESVCKRREVMGGREGKERGFLVFTS
jgi:hypothetical protein